jgi:DNA-binding NtrC family response regulator
MAAITNSPSPFEGCVPLPAAVVVVHDERNFRDLAVVALRAAFLEAIGFEDPLAALDAIEVGSRVRVLVTRVDFGPGKPNGIALARMIRVKRPGTKVVFVAREEYAAHAEGLGVFLPMPLTNPDILVATISRLLVTQEAAAI